MRIVLFISATLLMLLFNSAKIHQDGLADSLLGTWLIENGEARISIYKNAQKYYGKITWMKEPNDKNGNPKKDSRNQNESLRNRSLLNMTILKDFEYHPANKLWHKGKIYKPGLGQNVDCIIYYVDSNTIKVKGLLGWLSETQVWKRVL